eukprot:4631109-Prymnesium_polylepis.2
MWSPCGLYVVPMWSPCDPHVTPRDPTWQLVYSSAESIAAAMRCGRGVYWSRSRNGLWRKGDSSGAWQVRLKVLGSEA